MQIEFHNHTQQNGKLHARVLQHLAGAFGRLTPRIDRVALHVEDCHQGACRARCTIEVTARGTTRITAARLAATPWEALHAALLQVRGMVTERLERRAMTMAMPL